MELVHGGDWAGYRAEFGRDALDFSANVSPLGLPAGVAAAITAALPMADRYPDPLCRALRTKLAAAEGVDAAQISRRRYPKIDIHNAQQGGSPE